MADPSASPARRWVDIPIALPPPGETETFSVGELDLLLCNAEGTPYVVRDRCPHVQTSMKGGRLTGTVLECPLHGGRMDVRDGSPVAMPIRRPGICHPVRPDGDGWQVEVPV